MKAVGSLERLSNPPLDHSQVVDRFMNTKKRGIRELTTSETASKETKTRDGDGNASEANNGYKNDDNSDNNDAETTSSQDEKGGTPVEILLEEEEATERRVTTACVSHGLASVIGRRRVMEDAVAVAIGEIDSYDFFAVYDGHGGAQVANACRERMHRLVAEEVISAAGSRGRGVGEVAVDWQKVMAVSFEKMDAEVSSGGGGGGCSDQGGVNTVGSTAVVVMVGKEMVVVANCGDSRAILCRGGVAVPLSRDHKVMLRRFWETLLRTYPVTLRKHI